MALLRPGRFDRHVQIPLPDEKGRKEIFEVHIKPLGTKKDIDIDQLAKETETFTGADIKAVCTEAGMNAIRNRRVRIKQEDFTQAIKKVAETKKTTSLVKLVDGIGSFR